MAQTQKQETFLPQIKQQQRQSSGSLIFSNQTISNLKLLFALMFSYEVNIQKTLKDVDQNTQIQQSNRVTNALLLIKNAPGNKRLQLIFCYFWQTYGLLVALILTLFYPLPACVLFYYLNSLLQLLIPTTYYVTLMKQIVLLGIRCSVVSYLLKYCLHFPDNKVNWITYIGSIVVGIVLKFFASSNLTYFYILMYLLGILISYYKKQEESGKEQLAQQKQAEKELIQSFKKIQHIPRVNAKVALIILVCSFLFVWYLGKFHDQKQFGNLKQYFIVAMMHRSQETSIFYFPIAAQNLNQHISLQAATNYYGFGYILPGLHLKSFFLIFQDYNLSAVILSYFALHLPSLLLLCIYIGFSSSFQTVLWRNISWTIQFISNGLILVTVWKTIEVEQCHQNIIVFTAVVILTIIKLYKLNQMISALLGIALVASRASALHFSKKKTIDDFLCWSKA